MTVQETAITVPDELRRTIDSHLWLTDLEVSSGINPNYVCELRNAQKSPSQMVLLG